MTKENLYYITLVVITFVVAGGVTFVLRKLLGLFIKKYAKRLSADPTNYSFLKNSIGFFIFILAFVFIFYKIPYLKTLGTALFAGASFVAVAVGFASQKAFANIIGGVFILIFKPFKIGDVIDINANQRGAVEEMTLRHTIIKDFENRRIIIPNSIISEATIINSHIQDEKIRKHIVFGIGYNSDIDKAMAIIFDEAVKHPLCIDARTNEEIENNVPQVIVRVIALSDFAVNLKAYVWAKNNADAFVLNCDLLKSVKQRFEKEGIEIPYPYRNVVYKNNIELPHNTEK